MKTGTSRLVVVALGALLVTAGSCWMGGSAAAAFCRSEDDATRVLRYVSEPDVSFYCEGSRDWAHARFWEREGHHVQEVELVFADGTLEAVVRLFPDDSLGTYQYHIAFTAVSYTHLTLPTN